MADEGSTRGRSEADGTTRSELFLLHDGADDTTEAAAPKMCAECGARADWVLTDCAGVAQGFICVPCHELQRRRRKRWHRRVTRHLRHAVRRT